MGEVCDQCWRTGFLVGGGAGDRVPSVAQSGSNSVVLPLSAQIIGG